MAVVASIATDRNIQGARENRLVAEFTRPADSNAYVAGDVVSETTSSEVLEFTGAGNYGTILGAGLVIGSTVTASFDLLLFDQEPTNIGDNVALALVAADAEKLIGRLSFADGDKVNLGTGFEHYTATLGGDTQGLNFTSTDGSLYALLVIRDGATLGSAAQITVHLHVNKG